MSIKTFLLYIGYMHFPLLYTPVQLVLLHRSSSGSSHLMMMTIMMMMLYTVGFWCGVYSLLENCCWTALWINPIYMCAVPVHPVRGYHSKSTSFKFFLGQKLYKECYVPFFHFLKVFIFCFLREDKYCALPTAALLYKTASSSNLWL